MAIQRLPVDGGASEHDYFSENSNNTASLQPSSPIPRKLGRIQRLSSHMNIDSRRQQGSWCCSVHHAILASMLLCVGFLSFVANWNDLKSHQQHASFNHPRQQTTAQSHQLTFIPSVDEISPQPKQNINRSTMANSPWSGTPITNVMEASVLNSTIVSDASFSSHKIPLSKIVDGNNKIIGDPEWLLDFAILGYGKCGTSTMMYWLKEHPEIQAFGREKGHFMARKPGLMVRQLYENLEPGPYQRGYKAPQDVTQTHILDYYRAWWPNAKFILGIRHPVRWFESLYNFRIQNLRNPKDLPHPNNLIGACRKGRYLTCTDKGDFAYSLLKLGQQNYPSSRPATKLELEITGRRNYSFDTTKVEYMYNPIFIFELDQLSDNNATRNELFRSDFTKFMGLKEPLPALPHFIPGKKRDTKEQVSRNALKIQICNDEYQIVRNELMILARATSRWIREVFLNGPTVTVSSREYFESILEGWMHDPCDSASETNDSKSDDLEEQ